MFDLTKFLIYDPESILSVESALIVFFADFSWWWCFL